MAWRSGEARREKVRLVGRVIVPHLLGVLQKNENGKEILDIQKREGSIGAKNHKPIEVAVPARERI
jgi:hypothetical protein